MITLKEVTKFFGSFKVIDSISLNVEKGEFFVILGKSGSGKTTLLRLIAGLEKVSSGKILISNEDVTDLPPSKRDIGMVFQSYALYPNKKVFENLMIALENSEINKKDKEERIIEISKQLEIYHLMDKYPAQLSGGQQQRVAIAKALVKRPKVLLMDEPLSNLDVQLRYSARKLIKKVQKEFNITTIYVTHDSNEALAIADRIGVIDKGRLLQVGIPEDIYNNPLSKEVASLVGNPPMSFVKIDGKIIGVRPDNIIIKDNGTYEGIVSNCEFWGSYYLIYIDFIDNEVKAISKERIKEGSKVKFDFISYKVFSND
ncbi:ABC transporter ATP-binding protein [Saccharolobus solfataricus]|uniref:ABC transporter, ATP binding protein n=3 Tax=Saccharolobus solfataricus TaxID=2287 RepID=Q97VC1_SACS2|nr:ABC transporter ATP-binding protein [Saccharolobus solfataricus]AAK42824.1 ABC transporter, ATP binding protein [Saccharolobus solfataricus P2]AZF67430.1 ABC transporter ATP-binding protein [Saccharolobus solfataricus]AZF70050.1 ABC transporter ATP-binding protein [Saccharolobus solfataricus]AZF72670.1 ABC transporter ATP-binding protein [Saccharolobus solfataricus]AZF75292.1 ABC transporter ATP-binding protein [Saccharolobus solfataricus]